MFHQKSLIGLSVLLFIGLLSISAANAQVPSPACPYTLASLKGTYALVGTYGANLAVALGMRTYDGNGNLTATFILNQPKAGSATGERTITSGTQKGTYTVNCDGFGVFLRDLKLADGTTVIGYYDDFIITEAMPGNPNLATKIIDAQRSPSAIVPGGAFLTRVHTRLPDPYDFSHYYR